MEGDIEKSVALLKEVRSNCKDTIDHVNDLCKRAENGDVNTSKGISFLEVKYQMLLTYLVNLTFVMLKKCRGEPIKDDPSIERLVEIRTVLEKMRPIDQKLKYQIDKVIQLAATGGKDSNDPMRFKANPDGLESKFDDDNDSGSENSSDEEGDTDKKESRVYRPPKLAAAHYEDNSKAERMKKQLEHAKKRALNSDIMRDLKAQYEEGPEEIRETQDIYRLRADNQQKKRTLFEEDNFIRLQVTKKDKHTENRMATVSSLDSITKFGSISALDIGDGDMEFGAKRRRTTSSKTGKKGGKGKKGKKGTKKKHKFH